MEINVVKLGRNMRKVFISQWHKLLGENISELSQQDSNLWPWKELKSTVKTDNFQVTFDGAWSRIEILRMVQLKKKKHV